MTTKTLRECSVRGTKIKPGETYYTTSEEDIICEEEFKENWFESDYSGKIFHNDYMQTAYRERENRLVSRRREELQVSQDEMDSNFSECLVDQEYYPTDEMTWVECEEGYICNRVHREDYFECHLCGELFRNEDAHNFHGGQYCESCYDEARDEEGSDFVDGSDVIREYGPTELTPIGNGPLFMGCELEVEVTSGDREDMALKCAKILGTKSEIKDDGSLDDGFEIATAPMEPDALISYMDSFLDLAPKRGLTSWNADTCGFHVHVSRKPLTSLQIGKIIVFVGADHNRAFMRKLAGRNSSYGVMRPLKISDCKKRHDRYDAVNLTNRNTIEFRLFRGSLNRDRITAYLSFVKAIVAYCAPGNCSIADLKIEKFLSFLQENRKAYLPIYTFCVGNGYITPRVKKLAPAATLAPCEELAVAA